MNDLKSYAKINHLFSVRDRVVFITGAGGLASMYAEGFASNGATVILASHTLEKANAVCRKLAAKGLNNCESMELDVSDQEQVRAVIDALVERHGRLDICIHTAALCKLHPLMEDHADLLQAHVDANLMGTYYVNRLAGAQMVRQGWGRIININTMSSSTVNSSDGFSYGVTKTAMRQITRYFGIMLAPKGVTVNEICPIWIRTPMMSTRSSDYWHHCLDQIPMERTAVPEDYLGIALYMASEAGRFMSGQSVFVDGAWSVSRTFKFDTENQEAD